MKHWTRESWIASIQRPMPYGDLEDHARKVIDDLLAERDSHRCAEDAPVTYRLADKLGGLPVRILTEGDWRAGCVEWLRIEVAGMELQARRSDLVEVRPPSIDDPVTWPLRLTDGDGCRIEVESAANEDRVAYVRLTAITGAFVAAVPDVEQAEQIARALWQRAKAMRAEATP